MTGGEASHDRDHGVVMLVVNNGHATSLHVRSSRIYPLFSIQQLILYYYYYY
jgi:hypothetical protein